jgi:hypothetical protein
MDRNSQIGVAPGQRKIAKVPKNTRTTLLRIKLRDHFFYITTERSRQLCRVQE